MAKRNGVSHRNQHSFVVQYGIVIFHRNISQTLQWKLLNVRRDLELQTRVPFRWWEVSVPLLADWGDPERPSLSAAHAASAPRQGGSLPRHTLPSSSCEHVHRQKRDRSCVKNHVSVCSALLCDMWVLPNLNCNLNLQPLWDFRAHEWSEWHKQTTKWAYCLARINVLIFLMSLGPLCSIWNTWPGGVIAYRSRQSVTHSPDQGVFS